VSRARWPAHSRCVSIRAKPDPEYEYLVVAFHPTSYQIRGLKTRNRQAGETTIVFSDIKENSGIPTRPSSSSRPAV
jgi:outer membrane lipoprotein-sorting protein